MLMMGDNAARYDAVEMRALIDDMAAECTAVVRALGGTFAFPPMEFVEKVRSGEIPRSRHAGSMALDIARGVPTEIDELTGFIVACSLVRPDGIESLDADSVKKKMKKKDFAKAISREDIENGAKELGVTTEEHIETVIDAMKGIREELGL